MSMLVSWGIVKRLLVKRLWVNEAARWLLILGWCLGTGPVASRPLVPPPLSSGTPPTPPGQKQGVVVAKLRYPLEELTSGGRVIR